MKQIAYTDEDIASFEAQIAPYYIFIPASPTKNPTMMTKAPIFCL